MAVQLLKGLKFYCCVQFLWNVGQFTAVVNLLVSDGVVMVAYVVRM